MSIIEKAAGKLEQIEKFEKAAASSSIIESAAAKVDIEERHSGSQAPTWITSGLEGDPEIGRIEPTPEANHPHLNDTQSHSNFATIDLERLHQMGMVNPIEDKTHVSEEFRIIKRPLIKNAFNHASGLTHKGNLIMVTSALEGEGKSFCAINLAMSIAMEMDHTVLLIDADFARPSVPKYLGIKSERGLMDVILDQKLELSDVLLKTNVEKLSILTAGRKSKRATEHLASQNMSDLLSEIAQRYKDRIVIFDAPPLLQTSEARVLASQMGQIVVVVEAEETSQKTVKHALQQIESCESINLIYNKARPFGGAEKYGYYY